MKKPIGLAAQKLFGTIAGRAVLVAMLCVLGLGSTSKAQPLKKCSKLEVLSLHVEQRLLWASVADPEPKLNLLTAATEPSSIEIIVTGPVLGSMDSPETKLEILCTKAGAELVASISRSAQYKGATLENQLWRPVITSHIRLTSHEAIFQSTWGMQLTNGEQVRRGRTPPYPEQIYPTSMQLALRSSSEH